MLSADDRSPIFLWEETGYGQRTAVPFLSLWISTNRFSTTANDTDNAWYCSNFSECHHQTCNWKITPQKVVTDITPSHHTRYLDKSMTPNHKQLINESRWRCRLDADCDCFRNRRAWANRWPHRRISRRPATHGQALTFIFQLSLSHLANSICPYRIGRGEIYKALHSPFLALAAHRTLQTHRRRRTRPTCYQAIIIIPANHGCYSA